MHIRISDKELLSFDGCHYEIIPPYPYRSNSESSWLSIKGTNGDEYYRIRLNNLKAGVKLLDIIQERVNLCMQTQIIDIREFLKDGKFFAD